jgi:hypothetical protein
LADITDVVEVQVHTGGIIIRDLDEGGHGRPCIRQSYGAN